MRLIPLVRTASGRLAAKVAGVRIAGASALKELLVYDPGENAYIPDSADSVLRIPGFFGDGRDGPVVYAEDTTLHADVRATAIVVNPGVTVYQNGFEQSATGSITNNGTIHNDGPGAVADSPGIAHSAVCTAGMTSGNGGFLGANGGPTRNALVDFYSVGQVTAESLGAAGGDGGGPSNGPGGTNVGNWTYDPTGPSPFSSFSPTFVAYVFCARWADLFGTYVGGITVGAGGGGGTPDTGGAGGAGGSIVRLRAPRIINNGLISANGGNGGDAVSGNSGGGGGGGGGRIVIVCSDFVRGTLSVAGGAGGSGSGSGTDGQPGSDGTTHIFGAV